jgi:hypothetical protein
MAPRLSTRAASLAVWIVSVRASAAPPAPVADSSATRAEARFRAASEAFDQGRVNEACAAFAESGRLYPTLGTLLNLALCHERQGKTATAWTEFAHAAAWAGDAAQADRREFARQHALRLEHLLSRVQIELPLDAQQVELSIDGEPLAGVRGSLPVFLDPGEHTVSATVPLRKPYVTKVTVSETPPQTALVVRIPALEGGSERGGSVSASPVRDSPQAGASSLRTAGWILGGTGAALLGLGAAFGIDALVRTSACASPCDATSSEAAEAISLVAFGTGLAALVGGAWLLHLHPSPASSPGARVYVIPRATVQGAGFAVAGSF